MQMKLITSVFIGIFIVFNSYAADSLCTISSDIDTDTAKLTYELDETATSIAHLYQETYVNNKLTTIDEINLSSITAGGIILLKKDNIVVVRIWSDNFDRNLGGVLYIDTLYNGLSGERRQYEMDVTKSKTGYVLSSSKAEFGKMKFIAKRSKVFGVIGIDKILFSK